MVGDDEIPDAPLLVEIQIIQGRTQSSRRAYGGQSVPNSNPKKCSTLCGKVSPMWASTKPRQMGQSTLRKPSGKGSDQAPSYTCWSHFEVKRDTKPRNRKQQAAIWLKVAGSTTPEPTELQAHVLSEPVILAWEEETCAPDAHSRYSLCIQWPWHLQTPETSCFTWCWCKDA